MVFERHIKLLAKVLQSLANMTECKEPFMLPLSDFLFVNKPRVIKFIDDISNLGEMNEAHVIRINDFYEETGDSNQQKTIDINNEVYLKTSCNRDKPTNLEKQYKEDRNKNLYVQFENASNKYLAILNRLLNTFVPEMKSYLEDCKKKSNRSSRSNSSEGENIKKFNSNHLKDSKNYNNLSENCETNEQSDDELKDNRSKNHNDSEFQLSLEKLINILNRINGK